MRAFIIEFLVSLCVIISGVSFLLAFVLNDPVFIVIILIILIILIMILIECILLVGELID